MGLSCLLIGQFFKNSTVSVQFSSVTSLCTRLYDLLKRALHYSNLLRGLVLAYNKSCSLFRLRYDSLLVVGLYIQEKPS